MTELCEGGDLFSRILHHYERTGCSFFLESLGAGISNAKQAKHEQPSRAALSSTVVCRTVALPGRKNQQLDNAKDDAWHGCLGATDLPLVGKCERFWETLHLQYALNHPRLSDVIFAVYARSLQALEASVDPKLKP